MNAENRERVDMTTEFILKSFDDMSTEAVHQAVDVMAAWRDSMSPDGEISGRVLENCRFYLRGREVRS